MNTINTINQNFYRAVVALLEQDSLINLPEIIQLESSELAQALHVDTAHLGWVTQRNGWIIGNSKDGNVYYYHGEQWYKGSFRSMEAAAITNALPIQRAELMSSLPLDSGFNDCLNLFAARSKVIIGAYSIRLAEQILTRCISYSKTRHTFGVPIAKHQMIMDTIVTAASELDGNRLFLLEAARELMEGEVIVRKILRETAFLAEQSTEIIDKLIPVMGAYGVTEEAGIIPHIKSIYQLSVMGGER